MSKQGRFDPRVVQPEASQLHDEAHGAATGGRSLKDWAVQIGAWLGAVMVLSCSVVLGQVITLTCERAETGQIDGVIQSKFLGIVPMGQYRVGDVQGARVAELCDADGCNYRVELRTGAGIIPLSSSYSPDRAEKEAAAERVNIFVQDPTATSLRVEHFDLPALIWSAGVVAIFFLLLCARLYARLRRWRSESAATS